MKVLTIIFWLILGVLYYFIWDYQQEQCCISSEISNAVGSLEMAKELDGSKDQENFKTITDSIETVELESLSNDTIGSHSYQQLESEGILINFTFNSSVVNIPDSTGLLLDNLLDYMENNPNKTVSITGHTDSFGSIETNLKIGLIRAEKIKQFLIDKGASGNAIHCQSMGEAVPIADNTTAIGREKNRRIELTISK